MAVTSQLQDNSAAVEALLKAACDQAERAGANRLRDNIQARTPVRTGRLRSSYHVEREGGQTLVTNSSDTDYAQFVEFGTKYDAAQPHVRPGLEATAPEFLANTAATVRKAI